MDSNKLRAWFECFTSHLLPMGFVASSADSSLFVRKYGSSITYLQLYVDDIIVTGSDPSYINTLVSQLRLQFDMTDLGCLKYFLGLEIARTAAGISVTQSKYARDIIKRFGMTGCKPCVTHMSLTSFNDHSDSSCSIEDSKSYREIVGALQYLTFTRPDIAFGVSKLSQYMHSPASCHLSAAKRILCYIHGTLELGLLFKKSPHDFTLNAFSDSDWSGNSLDCRSTTGFGIFLGVNPVSWGAKKHTTVSRSSTEAEYWALASTTAELFWICQLLKDFHIFGNCSPLLLCDNQSAIQLACNLVFHGRTKHVEVDFHFVRERVVRNVLQYVSTDSQLADIFTKPLTTSRFSLLRSKLLP